MKNKTYIRAFGPIGLINLFNKTRVFYRFHRWAEEKDLTYKGSKVEASLINDNMNFPCILDNMIADVCGYVDPRDMAANYREETTMLLYKLGGPNGWAVYKALLARKNGD